MSELDQYSGFDRASILLQVLGEPLALTLFNSIAESDLLKLRVRSKELSNIPMVVKKAVLDEYYFKIMSDRYRDKGEDNDVFRFIKNLNDEQIWELMKYTNRSNWDGILMPKTDPEMRWLNGRTALKEGEFLWNCVPKISCDTMIMRGKISTVLDLDQANEMASKIPKNKGFVKEIDGAGHGLHSENKEGTVMALKAFFSG